MDDTRFWAPLLTANRFYNTVMAIALVALIVLLINGLREHALAGVAPLVLFLLAGLVVNVCVNAGLVMTADRFGTKTAWLVPFCALLMIQRRWWTSRGKDDAPAP